MVNIHNVVEACTHNFLAECARAWRVALATDQISQLTN